MTRKGSPEVTSSEDCPAAILFKLTNSIPAEQLTKDLSGSETSYTLVCRRNGGP